MLYYEKITIRFRERNLHRTRSQKSLKLHEERQERSRIIRTLFRSMLATATDRSVLGQSVCSSLMPKTHPP